MMRFAGVMSARNANRAGTARYRQPSSDRRAPPSGFLQSARSNDLSAISISRDLNPLVTF
jgi:hypothetical protein